MGAKPNLYELLGVSPHVSVAEVQAAYRRCAHTLEATRGSLPPEQFADRSQLLRLALSTLTDPVTRQGYDQKLIVLALSVSSGNAARADALALRADALALRADAIQTRADVEPQTVAVARLLASGTLKTVSYVTRAIGVLVIVGFGSFMLTRCNGDSSEARRAVLDAKAQEKTLLQEYYNTHGVRPANMAELELLNAERRRRDNQARAETQDRNKEQREQRSFEEESRRRGREVSERLRMDEERQQMQIVRDRERAEDLMARKRSEQRAREDAEQWRNEREREMWRETLRR